jgi:serine/threonine-protein kinase
MAEVYLAREDTEGGATRNVVVKVARPHLTETHGFEELFTNEGRVAMLLTHPNICHVYEFGKQSSRYFMAMEWVNGISLRELIRRATERKKPLPVPVVVRIASQIAEALDSAHRARDGRGRPLQIVHRDVSPHNVMVSFEGVVKLLDFGVAKGRNTKETTQSGTVKGKFNYMSPEQCTGAEVDGRADIFALGVCIWEALSGRMLFKRESQYETFRAIIEDPAPPLSKYRDDIPDELAPILEKALAKGLEHRYATAADLHDDLEKLLSKLGEIVSTGRIAKITQELFANEIAAGPKLDTSPEIIARALPAESLAPPTMAALPPPHKLNWVIPAAAGTLGVLAGVALIVALTTTGDPPPPRDTTPEVASDVTETVTPAPENEPAMVEPSSDDPSMATPPDLPPSSDGEGEHVEGVEDETASSSSRRGSMRRGSMGARMQADGFVTDPGF